MILFLLAAACLITIPISGGRLGRLADLDLQCVWAAPLALVLQVLIITVAPGGNSSLHAAIHLGTYGLGGFIPVGQPSTTGCAVAGLRRERQHDRDRR